MESAHLCALAWVPVWQILDVAGSVGPCAKLQAGTASGSSSSENQERIRQWLQQNAEPALPAAAAAKRRQERGAAE